MKVLDLNTIFLNNYLKIELQNISSLCLHPPIVAFLKRGWLEILRNKCVFPTAKLYAKAFGKIDSWALSETS